MSAVITIQPGQPGQGMGYDVHQPLPLPFHIDAATGTCLRGRGTSDVPGDDPTGSTPWRLLGFQRGDTQEIVLTLAQFRTTPQRAVGLVPIFLDWRGQIFALTVPITHVTADAPRVVEAVTGR